MVFFFFLPIKTIILDWQDRQLLFIVSVEDFYFIFLLSGGSGEKKKSVSVFYLDHFNFSLTPCRAKHVIFSYHPHIVLTRVADRRFSCLQTAGWWSWLILNVNIGNLTAHLSGLSSGKGTKNSLLYTWGNSKQSLKELL